MAKPIKQRVADRFSRTGSADAMEAAAAWPPPVSLSVLLVFTDPPDHGPTQKGHCSSPEALHWATKIAGANSGHFLKG